jgi:AhpD family alkylhydroperoxidase
MKNPFSLFPEALKACLALSTVIHDSGLDAGLLGLVHMRASQVNGCSFCVELGVGEAKKRGEDDMKMFAVSAWRESPRFTEAERAALALAESVTRLSDRADPVPDEVWNEAARHFNEKELAALLLEISLTNVWNRTNVPTRQPAGSWG